MKITEYFRTNVLPKRPYLTLQMCEAALAAPVRREQQPDGRIRHWGWSLALQRWLRVVTLSDGETVHNAFPDRRFKP